MKKEHIGSSDIATLILAGFKEGKGVLLQTLHFGEDRNYEAYIVEGKDVKIGNHYSKIEEYDTWMKIYDDDEGNIDFSSKVEVLKLNVL